MKRKAESAWFEDVDSDTEEVVEDTRSSASIFVPAESFQARRKSRRNSDRDNVQSSQSSSSLGLIFDLIQEHAGNSDGDWLTILACRYDDNAAVWQDCQSAMKNCRVFYLADEIVNRETATHAEREIVVSKDQDLSHPSPSIIIAQRLYDATNTIRLHAHRLSFDGAIDPDRTYIFPRFGDEIPSVGGAHPSIHCRLHAIEQFGQYSRFEHFVGFDRDVSIKVSTDDVKADRRIVYDFARDIAIMARDDEPATKPVFGLSVQAKDLAPFLPVKGDGDGVKCPSAKRRYGVQESDAVLESQPRRTLYIRLVGAGSNINAHLFNTYINVRFEVG